MVGHGGSSAGSYLADPTSPIPSHCASIVVTSTLRVNKYTQLTLKALEGLENLDESVCGELLVVLGGDLDTHLQVLADVGCQHGLKAFQGVFN